MDFRFTEEEERFRQEVVGFLDKEMPLDWVELGTVHAADKDELAFTRSLQKKMAQKGWLAMTWPKEYGGSERTHMEEVILVEEMAYRGVPGWDVFGSGMFGPVLLKFGTEEQKKEYLPPIARGELIWCEGFTEPGAGSDLASLQTKALDDGDDFVVNGQKVYSTDGHNADWIFFLARTDPAAPKHRGISFLYADMKTSGITVRPLINITNRLEFNEIYFDDVRVPKKNIVGEKDKGWAVAGALLDFERSGVRYLAKAQRLLDDLMKFVKETNRGGKPLAQDPVIRQELGELAAEVEVCRLFCYRIAWQQSKHLPGKFCGSRRGGQNRRETGFSRRASRTVGKPFPALSA